MQVCVGEGGGGGGGRLLLTSTFHGILGGLPKFHCSLPNIILGVKRNFTFGRVPHTIMTENQ